MESLDVVGHKLSRPRTRYSPEFRRRIVDLVLAGRPLGDVAKEFGPSTVSIRNWVARAQANAGDVQGPSLDERRELIMLRQENRILREEIALLKKEMAWFGR